MIYDSFVNFDRYRTVAPEVWDKVKSFLIKATQNAVPGKFPIHNDNCFANVAVYDTQNMAPEKLEAHEEYLDIQLTVKGRERIFCRDIFDLDEVIPFDSAKDIAFYRLLPDHVTELVIGDGKFAVFYPGEGHLPGCSVEQNQSENVLKVIVKIHRSYLR